MRHPYIAMALLSHLVASANGDSAPAGQASLFYGPEYNLEASANYKIANRESKSVNAWLLFDGMRYTSDYPGIPYDGKVSFRRNTVSAGADGKWKLKSGCLDAALSYQYSAYNFPILDLPTLLTDHHDIDANVGKFKLGWGQREKEIEYSLRLNYDVMYFGKDCANNNLIDIAGTIGRHLTHASEAGLGAGYSFDHSEAVGNKGIVRMQPYFKYASKVFKIKLGADIEIAAGNCFNRPPALFSPDIDMSWTPSHKINVWGKVSGKIDGNSRISLYNEQPYLLADFDAGFSRIYNGEAGVTAGAFKGFRFGVFGGYTLTYDWYIPALTTGYMSECNVKGWHGGIMAGYDYRKYVSADMRLEMAESPDGDYSRGYAPWRDHARLNLIVNSVFRPHEKTEISVGYHLRDGRQKQLPAGNMDLRTISNLKAGISYHISDEWTVSLKGDNLLDKQWYKGPAVPCQGIKGLIGVTYKIQ